MMLSTTAGVSEPQLGGRIRELTMSLAFLYIDPTAGGIGLQILLTFLIGGFVTIKLMWARFLSFIPFVNKGEEATDEQPAVAPQVSAETGED